LAQTSRVPFLSNLGQGGSGSKRHSPISPLVFPCRSSLPLAATAKAAVGSTYCPPLPIAPLVPSLAEPSPQPPSAVHLTTICGWLRRALVLVRTQPVRPFANRIAPMDSNLNDEISTIACLNNEFYYKNFLEGWSDSESDDDSYLMAPWEVSSTGKTRSTCLNGGAP
jgi:hypothetical protein